MADEGDEFDGTRVDVTASKPGRWVGVVVDRPVLAGERFPWAVVLSVEDDDAITGAVDTWTGLAPDEARAIARALTDAADDAEARNASDPREPEGQP
jgi:hypothetical protein